MSKLYIDNNIGILFYAAGIFVMGVGISLIFIANDIKKKKIKGFIMADLFIVLVILVIMSSFSYIVFTLSADK